MLAQIIIAIVGLLVSAYAYVTELNLHKNKDYHALCDINNRISCSRAFMSKYGKMFGISNSLGGIFFYLTVIVLSFFNPIYVFYLSIIAVLGSIVLAYFSYIKLRTFCLVCTAAYLINILLFIFSYLKAF